MAKVVCISDTHMQHLDLEMPDGDILIHAGDGTDMGEVEEFVRLNAWFRKLKAEKYKDIIYVPGNHDLLFQDDPQYAREIMKDVTVLIDEGISVQGKSIYGSPWSVTFFDWAFMKPDLNLSQIWAMIPENLDMLITHSPPYGILDENARGTRCGSMTLMKEVLDKKPKFHVFGHIHEDGGKEYSIEPTTFINIASCPVWKRFDVYIPKPKVIEL